MNEPFKQFVFKGLLARHAVADLETAGLLHSRLSTNPDRVESELFLPVQETIRNGSLQMQRAYRILFVLENVVRDLLVKRFEEKEGADWFEVMVSSQMKLKVTQRKEQESRNQWHTGRNAGAVFYLDFGDLSKLITTHWSLFEDLLPSQAWVQSRLEEAERSRNVIAHTNVLSAEEVGRLELYLRDWIRQVG